MTFVTLSHNFYGINITTFYFHSLYLFSNFQNNDDGVVSQCDIPCSPGFYGVNCRQACPPCNSSKCSHNFDNSNHNSATSKLSNGDKLRLRHLSKPGELSSYFYVYFSFQYLFHDCQALSTMQFNQLLREGLFYK